MQALLPAGGGPMTEPLFCGSLRTSPGPEIGPQSGPNQRKWETISPMTYTSKLIRCCGDHSLKPCPRWTRRVHRDHPGQNSSKPGGSPHAALAANCLTLVWWRLAHWTMGQALVLRFAWSPAYDGYCMHCLSLGAANLRTIRRTSRWDNAAVYLWSSQHSRPTVTVPLTGLIPWGQGMAPSNAPPSGPRVMPVHIHQ